jgi:iron-sulfur cluster assembly protein
LTYRHNPDKIHQICNQDLEQLVNKGNLMEIEQTKTKQITITSNAAIAVKELLEKRELDDHALRVYIAGGGCAGYQYGMALEANIRDTDLIFDQHEVKVVVDEISIEYLDGSTIDYVDEVMGSGFKIENPNAVAACGCGSSFRTQESDQNTSGGCSSCY